jgi:hypothetical protein
METIGTVESLWRYPVKSMRGEELQEACVDSPEYTGMVSTPLGVPSRRKDFHFRRLRTGNDAPVSTTMSASIPAGSALAVSAVERVF